ncbi:condensation domain-containing protein [Roseivirga sp. BDSF3-8]|uniref:condensation domain-containing protein n=1 Tax=Roseivirga sp. BDSF3-8 TaxID=3241598 RepID=UPI0035322C62
MKKIIHARIEQSCKNFADNTAIEDGSGSYTYRQLLETVEKLAKYILAENSSKGGTVMVLLPRGFAMVTALLATLKSGKVFLPVSQNLGESSWKRIFQEIKPEMVISNASGLEYLNKLMGTHQQSVGHLILAQNGEESPSVYKWEKDAYIASETPVNTEEVRFPVIDPQDSSYLYFTSGSTGQPKIVEGKQVSLSHFIDWQVNELDYKENVKVSQLAAPTFDASLKDILPTLLAGGILCIPSEDVMANINHLYKWLKTNQIHTFATVPSIFRALMQEMEASSENTGNALPEVRKVLLAGEVLYRKDINRWQKIAGQSSEIINLYGTTESTILKTFHRVNKIDETRLEEPLSVGKPIGNTITIILNEDSKLCGINEPGEVYIKTPFLSKGYYNDPVATSEIFVTNPLTGKENDIVYKTGDEGVYLNDGSVKLIGRKDKQVKLNGIRLNLSGIASSLLQNENVAEVVCLLRQTKDGDDYLVCYFTGNGNIDEELLHRFAEEKLNKHEIPGHFVKLKSFPRSQHGKLDKSALPDPLERHISGVEEQTIDSLSETEKELKEIWEGFFKTDNIGQEDSFLQIGGNSLKALQVGALITQKMKVNLGIAGIQQLFRKPKLKDFASYLDELKGNSPKKIAGITRIPDAESYPVSYSQQQIYMACQSADANRAYNMPKAYQIKGRLNPDLFMESFRKMTDRYEILRTSFHEENEDIRQRVHSGEDTNFIRLIDLREEPDQALAISEYVAECTSHVFDLEKPGQLLVYLIQLSEDDFVMAVNIHHIIGDSWSAKLMASELFDTYAGLISKSENKELPKLPYQFRDYAVWERQQLHTEAVKPLKNYWLGHLGMRLPKLNLHTDHSRPEVRTMEGKRFEFEVKPELASVISKEASRLGVSNFTYMMSALYLLLFKYSADEEIVIGVPVATRNQPGLEDQLGVFVNTIAVKNKVNNELTLTDFIKAVHNNLQEGYKHQFYPFQEVVSHYHQQVERNRTPIFDVAMNMLSSGSEDSIPSAAGLEITDWESNHSTSKFDMTLYVYDDLDSGAIPFIEYNAALFETRTIERLTERYLGILSKMGETPDDSLKAILQEKVAAPAIKARRVRVNQ